MGASSSDSTTFTQAVSHGGSVTWRVTGSDTDGDFTGLTGSTVSSSTVDCTVKSLTVTQSLGTCSGGSTTSTLSITNGESYTAYLVVEYSINGGSYVVHLSLIHI